ncbi:hypothetical protein [Peribacillus tepidiphilus]|jgi:hypothetical protein|uniref:hypothetical protein n=1 Tax=Peribacillus tepidiphilus TaxID=2652445 RepID=UPI0012929A32|nr:hypothetical protein [Peribacillus tepidiphilus]
MENIGFMIFLLGLSAFVLYFIIETAVRRGIDSSKLSENIEEFIKKKESKP